MTKIKICGLTRSCDVRYVNEAKPDFCGFVINVPRSRRNASPDTVRALVRELDKSVLPVGVFVDSPPELVAGLLEEGTIGMAQLHGSEDESYIRALRNRTSKPIIQAFRMDCMAAAERAAHSSADFVLLDSGGGTGKAFDWSLAQRIGRPFFLAGGLTPETIPQAVRVLHPFAVDLSSGVETDGRKDKAKILAAIQTVRKE